MIKRMNSIISKIKEEMRNISMEIIGFVLVFIVGSYCIISSIKILGDINIMHMLYVFSCIVIAYVAALIYSYKIIKLEKNTLSKNINSILTINLITLLNRIATKTLNQKITKGKKINLLNKKVMKQKKTLKILKQLIR